MAHRVMYAVFRLSVERTEEIEADRRKALGVLACRTLTELVKGAKLLELAELADWARAQGALDGIESSKAQFVERGSLLGGLAASGVERLAELLGPKPQTLEELGDRAVKGLAGLGMVCVASELASLGVFHESLRRFADVRDADTLPAPDRPTKPPPKRARKTERKAPPGGGRGRDR